VSIDDIAKFNRLLAAYERLRESHARLLVVARLAAPWVPSNIHPELQAAIEAAEELEP
jgi:hypothetical protein